LAKILAIESGSNRIADLLYEKIHRYAGGELSHASEALLALIDALYDDDKGTRKQMPVKKPVSRNVFSLSVVLISFVQDEGSFAVLPCTESCT
jgi:hypothetical protein